MSRVTTPLAVSADYADALLAARRAKNWLFLLLLLGLLAQITIFFLVRYDVVKLSATGEATVSTPTKVEIEPAAPSTAPSATTENPTSTIEVQTEQKAVKVGEKNVTADVLAWVVNSIVYLSTILSVVMVVVILLIALVMLVGRLLGVAHTTSAFVWAVVFAALVFPWQLFYGSETSPSSPAYSIENATASAAPANDFRVPGVLYTWGEFRRDARFGLDGDESGSSNNVLKWARFAGFPIVALFILFMVQAKSGRGVKYALGEAELHVDVATDV